MAASSVDQPTPALTSDGGAGGDVPLALATVGKRRSAVREEQRGKRDGRVTPRSAQRRVVTQKAERIDPGGRRQRARTTLDLIRANPTGRIALKVAVAIAGAVVVVIGLALIPLPGPGWLLVIAGLGIWAVEFHWARQLLAFTRRHVHGWTRWVAQRSWPTFLPSRLACRPRPHRRPTA